MAKLEKFKKQDYYKLKKHHERSGTLFTDPLFPANEASLFFTRRPPGRIEWKRPGELCSNPNLFVEGISASDVHQGMLGNCWFVAACSVLAGVKELWHKVIPSYKEQEWDTEVPALHQGIFHFRFWRFGNWIDVVIDDMLPTCNGKLIFTHSKSRNEFWCALLEKAYAKLNGCYESLDGGNLSDALVDFTGGVSEIMDLTTMDMKDGIVRKELFKSLLKKKEGHALMCCAIQASSESEMEARTDVGLVKGHAYGITAIRKVFLKDTRLFAFLRGKEKIYMVRLRNPWGEKEWNGSFSDGSPEWSKITSSEREKLGLTFEDDGEFWMTFDDFTDNFTEVSVCYLLNTSIMSLNKTWQEQRFFGAWTKGVHNSAYDRSGGCANYPDSFLRNPQYYFDSPGESVEIVVQLMQRDIRDKRHKGVENATIGIHALRVELNRRYRLHTLLETAAVSDYIKTRAVLLRMTLPYGRYVMLPTTFKPGVETDYLLRIFSTTYIEAQPLKREAPSPSIWPCISSPKLATHVLVRGISGLSKKMQAYCIIRCEGTVVRSTTPSESTELHWNIGALFYRKTGKPIKIQVWERRMLRDVMLGHFLMEAPVSEGRKRITTDLRSLEDHDMPTEGKLTIEYMTSDDITSI
ncbi:calpain-5-like isoform X2 [Artemia franciscana]|uniref:calpain-5-like isoform X2 n=1 Tax=Artemia franciscana TaxID=6661 RepID=UPI0032DBB7A1